MADQYLLARHPGGHRRAADRRALARRLTVACLAALAVAVMIAFGNGTDPFVDAHRITVHDLDGRRPYPVIPADPLLRADGPVVFDEHAITTAFRDNPLLTDEQVAILLADGTTAVEGVLTRPDTTTVGTWRFTVRDASDPAALARDLNALYVRGGYTPIVAGAPGVLAVRSTPSTDTGGTTVYTAHYRHAGDILRVVAYGPHPAEVAARFAALLAAQLARAPVSGP